MPFGPRVINASGDRAEGDKFFEQSVSNTAGLTVGLPVYKDLTDAADLNAKYAQTALSSLAPRTGGKVVLSNSALTNIFAWAGVYSPENPGDLPAVGDIVRVLCYGESIISAISETGNGNALKVGDCLISKVTTTSASTAAQSPIAHGTMGVVIANLTFLTVGAQITAAANNVAHLVNSFINGV